MKCGRRKKKELASAGNRTGDLLLDKQMCYHLHHAPSHTTWKRREKIHHALLHWHVRVKKRVRSRRWRWPINAQEQHFRLTLKVQMHPPNLQTSRKQCCSISRKHENNQHFPTLRTRSARNRWNEHRKFRTQKFQCRNFRIRRPAPESYSSVSETSAPERKKSEPSEIGVQHECWRVPEFQVLTWHVEVLGLKTFCIEILTVFLWFPK